MSADEFIPLTARQRKYFGWLEAASLNKVIAALEAVEPGSARFVGGCVRDALFGATPKDFDVATTLEPDRVVAALKTAGLRSAPTGIEHGTVTAIVDHHGVEVTTLRADVSTDGRRATVAFTRDWQADAGRRDFTINAIYLTPDGQLYDPVAGIADIEAGRVRFIGDATRRIAEDFLRILRFFRFTARFSECFDEPGLTACTAQRGGIVRLSAERIGAELMAILALPRAAFALKAMQDAGVLRAIWDAPANIDAVARLKTIAPDALAPVVLAVLFGAGGTGIGARLRLSNAEKAIRSNTLKGAEQIVLRAPDKAVRGLIYRLGRDVFLDASAAAFALERIDEAAHARITGLAKAWQAPTLSVSGRHIIDAGVPPGPAIAKILGATEAQWIAEDFPESSRLIKILETQIAALRA
jgi:poly(A) polymerase